MKQHETKWKYEVNVPIASKYYPDKVEQYPYIGLLNLYCPWVQEDFPILRPHEETEDSQRLIQNFNDRLHAINAIKSCFYESIRDFTRRAVHDNLKWEDILEGQAICMNRCDYYLGNSKLLA